MLLFALGALAAIARAQTAPPTAIRFTVFSDRPVSGLSYTPAPKGAAVPLVFYPTARSPRYEYRGPSPLRFVEALSGAVVAEAVVPPEIHQPLLLFSAITPAPTTGLRYRIQVLDDEALHRAPAGLTILNLSGLALSGTVDQQAITLTVGLNAPIPLAHAAKVQLRTTLKNRSYQSYVDTIALEKSARALLILFPPFYQGSLEVQSRLLHDTPATAKPPADAPKQKPRP